MFTGLVEETGTIGAIEGAGGGARLWIECDRIAAGSSRGDSIAIDGCCLTAEELRPGAFRVFASGETLAKTTLGDRRTGARVNLERALRLDSRLGGHLVTGHVDGTGEFLSATPAGEARIVWISAPDPILTHCVPKGSVCVDGISLTLVDVQPDRFSLWIIPETWERTTLCQRRAGDRVNLESDLIAKYIGRFLEQRAGGDARLAALLSGFGGAG